MNDPNTKDITAVLQIFHTEAISISVYVPKRKDAQTTQNSTNAAYSETASNSRHQSITDTGLFVHFLKVAELDTPQGVEVSSLFRSSTSGVQTCSCRQSIVIRRCSGDNVRC